MKLESKFDFGQKVWALSTDRVRTTPPCGFCGGEQWVTGLNAERHLCPECRGDGHEVVFVDRGTTVIVAGTIGQIMIKEVRSPGGNPGCSEADMMGIEFDNYKAQASHKEEYMMVETGIGSGTCWHGEKLYASEDEAQAAADAANATLAEKK